MKSYQLAMVVQNCGLCINEKHAMLGATSDGLIDGDAVKFRMSKIYR